jgi:hypothetical protein
MSSTIWRRVRQRAANIRLLCAVALTPLLPACSRAEAAGRVDARIGIAQNGAPSCGAVPLAPCPLQSWMRVEASPAMRAEDAARLLAVFAAVERFAPPAYNEWSAIARRGQGAARGGDIEGARAACGDCHDLYRARYRAEMRGRPLP